MIGIINYGLGNIKALVNIYAKLSVPFTVVSQVGQLKDVAKIILPGVGAFDHAMHQLEKSGLRQSLEGLVSRRHVPVLGICVGMQMLAFASEEGSLPGLGWIEGTVKKFDKAKLPAATCLPHMGWNNVQPVLKHKIFEGIDAESRFYFLHSYYFDCHQEANLLAMTDYGGPFASAVCSGSILGVQFHPEKSHQWGIQLLKNFAEY